MRSFPRSLRAHERRLDMVGVDGSSPFAPTKFGRKIRHLTETLGACFLAVPKKYQKAGANPGARRRMGCLGDTVVRPTLQAWRNASRTLLLAEVASPEATVRLAETQSRAPARSGRSHSMLKGVLTVSAIKPTFRSAISASPSGSYTRYS